MTAAEEHLQTVMAAQGETVVADQLVTAIKAHAEATTGALVVAFDNVMEHVSRAMEHLSTLDSAITTAVISGEEHLSSSVTTGHGTEEYARTAKDHCDNANVKTPGVLELLEAIGSALEETKKQAMSGIMAALAPAEDARLGLQGISQELQDAEADINHAIHTR